MANLVSLLGCFGILFAMCYVASASSLAVSSALFIFGDSTVDPGNNNHMETIPENRADYKPYGQNGFFEGPTGRFSDGRVIVDFIAEYAKLPIIPPFRQPSAKYTKGVNFASGGAGILSETNQGLVTDLKTQLKNFEDVQKSLTENLGDEQAKKLISEAVYFFSIGSNDYMGGYLGNPKMQQDYNPEQYVDVVIGNLTKAIQSLYEKGGRKFGFLSLSPLGCLPALRILNPKASQEERRCFEGASELALAHNNALKAVLTSLEYLLKGFKYCNSNFYNWLQDRINNPSKYGFKEGVNACCGTGPYRGIYTCGGKKEVTDYELCDNAEDYVWWDSFHPTERIHEHFAKALWNGPPLSVGPYNLKDLFFNNEMKLTIADVVDNPHSNHFQF
ncbi:GDSL esterase/lipase 5 [Ziziphus jujuba]|uniref:GDSL esterase/lipase 5 n=1 Tax=Ziziphus jujuba TaxID=326968 RepID=A0ABM3ISR8_ZIZJJ|nr:GDSL esterase/lipase 5 [Ziziphus jujuba]